MPELSSGNEVAVIRTSSGLREALFEELDLLRIGKSDAKRANAVARLAAEILNTIQLEVAVERHLEHKPAGTGLLIVNMGRKVC